MHLHYDGRRQCRSGQYGVRKFSGKRNKVILSSLHPQYRQTVRTYAEGSQIVVVGDDPQRHERDARNIIPLIDGDTALLVVQYPDLRSYL
jgi:glycine cleavage system pyridoxal-binding protein P